MSQTQVIRLPKHIEHEADLYGEQVAKYVKNCDKGGPGYTAAVAKARMDYIRSFIKHTQIGR